LALSHANLATSYLQSGRRRTEVLAQFLKGRQIMAALVAIAPSNAEYTKNLAWFDAQIARLGGQVEASPQS
jgi:hypothetical protein